jgi:hypothetical protein
MYLIIIIKSSFNYYTHTNTVVLVAHDGSQIAETRFLSLSLVANTTAVTASTSIVSIIIISFALLFYFPFFSILAV